MTNYNPTTKLLKDYPNAKDLKIAQVFKPTEGWIRLWGQNLVELTFNNVMKAMSEGCTHINVRVLDEFGFVRYPDYTINELITKPKEIDNL